MKRASSQGIINMGELSLRSKQKIRKTIKSALGRQDKEKLTKIGSQKHLNKNSRACSAKSLISSRKSSDEFDCKNYYRKYSDKKTNNKLFDDKLSHAYELKLESSSHKKSLNLLQKQQQRKPFFQNPFNQPTNQKIVSKYQWWHQSKFEIQTQDRIKVNGNKKQYLTYFAYSKSKSDRQKKTIIIAFQNSMMYPGDPGLLIFGIDSKQELKVQIFPYLQKMQANSEKFSHYLICSPNQQTKSLITKEIINRISKTAKDVSQLMKNLIKLRIEQNQGSIFYLLIEINRIKSRSLGLSKASNIQTNIYKDSSNKSKNKRAIEVSKVALLQMKKVNKF